MPRSLHLNGPTEGDEPTYTITCDRTTGPQALRLAISAGSLHIYAGSETLRIDLPEPDESDVDAAWDRAVEALPVEVELVYVDRGDELSDEQIEKLLKGEPLYDESHFDEWESEQKFSNAWAIIEERVDTDDLDILKQTTDKVEELRFLIEERDRSDASSDLARNTPAKWFRYYLGDVNDVTFEDEEEKNDTLASIFDNLGLGDTPETPITDEVLRAISSVLANSQGGGLYLLWNGDIETMIDATYNDAAKTVTWENPMVLVFDRVAGSGYAEDLPATVGPFPFDRSHLHLDEGDGSYSTWVSGGMSPSTSTTVTVTTLP